MKIETASCVWVCVFGSFQHIPSGCKAILTRYLYWWRHNQVLKSYACLSENKQAGVNSLPVKDRAVEFILCEGNKSGH